jgi:spermidine synthase
MILLRRLLLIAYALSGSAALIYEVVWTRMLTLHLGHSAWAVSTVLAAFMGGMGAGALAGGAAALRRPPGNALRIYAALEVVIALCALAMPIALATLTPLLAFAYADGASGGFALARLGTTLVLLLVPTAAMGATFPIAARAAADSAACPGSTAGALYAANVAGACAGAALAGFYLVPRLGLHRTSLCAAALNLLAGGIAIWLAAGATTPYNAVTPAAGSSPASQPAITRGRHTSSAPARRTSRPAAPPATRMVLAASAMALTGFVALVNEVAWTRVLALTIGPTTYAFGAMLALFILGLAAGSSLSARLTSHLRLPTVALGVVLMLAGTATLVAMPQVNALPLGVADLVRASHVTFARVLRAEITTWAWLLLPLAAAFGAAFPLALRVAVTAADQSSREIAFLYGMNTAGAIAGSLAAGFVFVPVIGLQRTLQVAALLGIAGGVAVLAAARVRRAVLAGALTALVVLGSVVSRAAPWDVSLLSAGAYKYAPYVKGPDLESALRAGTLLYYRDGAAGTVSVRRAAGVTSLSIDGKVDASNAGDMQTQKLLAHVPLMLHARPRRVAIIGLGSGVTLGAALRHPIEHADTIEISREVVEASRFFATENHNALADPRSNVIVGDGRSHLMLTSAPYDVIISEPSNPWMAGIASLFTREFFLAARRALAADGILCQWAHTYDISSTDLRSIVATFASVFPDGTMWLVGQGDVLLISSPVAIVSRLSNIDASFARPGIAGDLAEVAIADAASVLAMYAGGSAEIRVYSEGAIAQTDDRNTLEFSAPHAIVGVGEDNVTALRSLAPIERLPPIVAAARVPPDAARWRDRGRMHLKAEAYGAAYDAFERAVSLDADDQSAVDGLVDSASGAGRKEAATTFLTTLPERSARGIAVRVGLSRLLASSGNTAGALEQVVPLVATYPDDPRPPEQAAAILAEVGDASHLRSLAEHLGRQWPRRSSGPYFAGTVAFLEGRLEDAVRLAREGLSAVAPGAHDEARLQTLLGAASASLGRSEVARAAFEAALTISPRDPVSHTNLGLLDLDAGAPEPAIGRFAEALILDPSSTAAIDGLAKALRQTGHPKRAARVEQSAATAGRPR